MSTEPEAVNRLLNQYEHRSPDNLESDLETQEILETYLEHEGVEEYSFIQSEFPYQALLGRSSDADAEITFTAHYTYLLEDELIADSRGVRVGAEDMEEVVREVLPEEKVIDVAGAEIEGDKRAETPSGEEIRPGSVHCVVFYDEPVPTEDMLAQGRLEGGLMHRKTLEEAVNEPSLATALITSGRTPQGNLKAGMQVDYWTRFIDGVEDGLDYTELDWENPAGEL